ncbi:MAG: hypothetical protein JXL20_02040 [Deltaproteobacteria bacterium]|nr:hypothetical protein [Deltaproteobacteria bacterium]
MMSLKACRTNAVLLPVAVKKDFDRLIGREVLIEGYGLTETTPLTYANPIEVEYIVLRVSDENGAGNSES